MKFYTAVVTSLVLSLLAANAAAATHVLFIGNSFTYGAGAAVKYYRADSVTDLNDEGIGGVPALFKSFADQVGLDYVVALETRAGSDLDFHLTNKRDVISQRPWDQVILQSYSTLDQANPGNPNKLVSSTRRMTDLLQQLNPDVEVFLTATWSRADLIYQPGGLWAGKPIEQMALDVRAGYDKAAVAPGVKAVNAVGQAWTRAMQAGIADSNPYDGIDFGQVSLWSHDYYHASDYGYYLEALVVFGTVTGIDPRSLGNTECSGYEFGMSRAHVQQLQQVAFEQLASESLVTAASPMAPGNAKAGRCQ